MWRNSLKYKSIPNKASWKVIHLFLQQISIEHQIHPRLSEIRKLDQGKVNRKELFRALSATTQILCRAGGGARRGLHTSLWHPGPKTQELK